MRSPTTKKELGYTSPRDCLRKTNLPLTCPNNRFASCFFRTLTCPDNRSASSFLHLTCPNNRFASSFFAAANSISLDAVVDRRTATLTPGLAVVVRCCRLYRASGSNRSASGMTKQFGLNKSPSRKCRVQGLLHRFKQCRSFWVLQDCPRGPYFTGRSTEDSFGEQLCVQAAHLLSPTSKKQHLLDLPSFAYKQHLLALPSFACRRACLACLSAASTSDSNLATSASASNRSQFL